MEYIKEKRLISNYISLFLIMLSLFINITSFRYYVFDNIYIAWNLGNLGAFGEKLIVTNLLNSVLLLGIGLAAILMFIYYKKIKEINIVTITLCWSVFIFILLMLNPFILQVLMPNQVMQNIVMINVIVIVLIHFINITFATFLLLSLILLMHNNEEKSFYQPIINIVGIIISMVISIAFIKYTLSYKIFLYILAFMLFINSAIVLIKKSSKHSLNQLQFNRNKIAIFLILFVAIIVLFIISANITGKLIQFDYI